MPRKADLLNDYAFKHVFQGNTPESKAALMGLLSICLGRKILNVTVLNSELTDPDERVKNPRLDILVELEDGELIDVEMQMRKNGRTLPKRLIYYHSKLYGTQEIKGLNYDALKETYVIMFLNANIYTEHDDLVYPIMYKNQYNESLYQDGKEHGHIIIVQMPKLDQSKEIDEMNQMERLVYYFLNCKNGMEDCKIKEMVEKDLVMNVIEKRVDKIDDDRWTRLNKDLDDWNEFEARAEEQLKIEEAVEKGREQGREQGKLEVAHNLKLNGVSDELISKSTGLSLEEIRAFELSIEE